MILKMKILYAKARLAEAVIAQRVAQQQFQLAQQEDAQAIAEIQQLEAKQNQPNVRGAGNRIAKNGNGKAT